jgi:hypothetical protein
MAFTNDQTGLERGAVQLLLTAPPRIWNRHQEGGPARAAPRSLPGPPIGVEYQQVNDDPVEVWQMEALTEAQTETLRQLLDSPGPLTAKATRGTATTFTATFGPDWEIDPVVGEHTNTAPQGLRYHRARVELLKQ